MGHPGRRAVLVAGSVLLLITAIARGQGYICAEGGGNGRNGVWAPAVFAWMVEHSGCGDVVILGVSDPDERLADIFLANGAATVTHLAVKPDVADLPETYEQIVAADIVWMRGGDQWNYVRGWRGTRTEQAIRDVYRRGGVVGGTSAGCAVLGEVIFDAHVGSLLPREALADAYAPKLTLTDDFLTLTPGVLFDTHFTERARLGRLVAMLARYREETCRDVIGIGVDYRTAFCVYPDLTAEVRGEGAATVLRFAPRSRVRVAPGEPPLATDFRYDQLTEGYRFDLKRAEIVGRPDHAQACFPSTRRTPFPALDLDGGGAGEASRGSLQVSNAGDEHALLRGCLVVTPGSDELEGVVLATGTWTAGDLTENRIGGLQYAMAVEPNMIGVYLDETIVARTAAPRRLWFAAKPGTSGRSTLVLDGRGMTSAAFSTWVSTPESIGPRQSVAIEGAVLHVIPPGMGFDAETGAVLDGLPPP